LRAIFTGRRKAGHLDLEAMETAVRSAMHRAGAAVLTELLQFQAPAADQRTVACPCGQQAPYRELRFKPVLTVVGRVKVSRPYYLCAHCHAGQFPTDVELDIAHTEFSPGVRRMDALVSHAAPFERGREQLKVPAGVEVTTKSVERIAEAIGNISRKGSSGRSRKLSNWTCPSLSARRFESCMCRWTALGYRR
jgi:hypothetical protein